MFNNYTKTLEDLDKFHKAVKLGDVKKVTEMIEANPNLDINSEMVTVVPIMYVAQREDWAMFTVLFEKEANLDIKNEPSNWYLVHECVLNAPLNIAKSVVTYCNINSQTALGETPLMIAIKNDKNEMANHMIDTERLEINLTDKEKNTALHYAAKYNNQELFLKLIKSGASLTIKNKKQLTPVDLIEDEIFKRNFYQQLNNVEVNASIEVVKVLEAKLEEKTIPAMQNKISGLSSIKKKLR
jgi:ankyrin repeat protein